MTCNSPQGTSRYPLRRALSTDSTATAFTAKVPTETKPSGDGVIDLTNPAFGFVTREMAIVDDSLFLQPYGSNAADETFDLRIWGWSPGVGDDAVLKNLWVPILLADLSVTLGNIAATDLGTDMYLADTITENDGDSDGARLIETVSPAEDLAAHALVDLRGVELIEFDFDAILAASMNCLWRPFST